MNQENLVGVTVPEIAEYRIIKDEMKSEVENIDDIFQVRPEDEVTLKELLAVDEQYKPLLILLEQFSLDDDGIQFNRKLKHFESTVTSMCPDEAKLQQAFATFRAAALLNSVTTRKLAAVGASLMRQQLLRTTLLNVVMQETFSKFEILVHSNPQLLINAANLMGDYFAKARLCNGSKVHILANPLLKYMRALLASDDIRAHKCLATQLMQNGRELISQDTAQDLDELSISIRLRLLVPSLVNNIWLLLSADLCLNKFLPLSNNLQQFYALHLELTPDENYSKVCYGSWKKDEDHSDSDASTDSGIKVNQALSQIGLSNEDIDSEPKMSPSLDAGAPCKMIWHEEKPETPDSFETWRASSKTSLAKRYDLNTWRQNTVEKEEESVKVLSPALLPNNLHQTYPAVITKNSNDKQKEYTSTPNSYETWKATAKKSLSERYDLNSWRHNIAKVESETVFNPVLDTNLQQTSPVTVPDCNNNRLRNTRDPRPICNAHRRNSAVSGSSKASKPGQRRHVTEVPRNQRYWAHDDRCNKDYDS